MKAFWYKGEWDDIEGNVGDLLTPIVVKYLSGEEVEFSLDAGKLLAIGSIIEFIDHGDTVFGSGLIRPKPLTKKDNVTFLCVRGRNTAKLLREIGYDVPEAYISPSIVMPDIYHPVIEKKYKMAYIAHYVEQDEYADAFPREHSINIINNPYTFIDKLLECESITTSSLHAFVLAEAYGIKATYRQLTDKIIGGYFKYEDYISGDNDKQMLINIFNIWN